MYDQISRLRKGSFAALLTLALLLAACGESQSSTPAGQAQKLNVAATTTLVADVVSQVGGDQINLSVLLGPGEDPHSFDPAPQEIAKAADAQILFASGAGLEETFLDRLMENAGGGTTLVEVSEGIQLLQAAEAHTEEDSDAHDDHATGDPHVWMNPKNVIVWTENIAAALQAADPPNADVYAANALAYIQQLEELDAWIREQVQTIPENQRKLVTDHMALTYFAAEYGFEQVGALIPSYSTMAEPSAADLARLEDAIRALSVRAILVGNTVNPTLGDRVAADTGIRLVYFYTGSLTEPGGEADSYLDFMRYNVNAIVQALQ